MTKPLRRRTPPSRPPHPPWPRQHRQHWHQRRRLRRLRLPRLCGLRVRRRGLSRRSARRRPGLCPSCRPSRRWRRRRTCPPRRPRPPQRRPLPPPRARHPSPLRRSSSTRSAPWARQWRAGRAVPARPHACLRRLLLQRPPRRRLRRRCRRYGRGRLRARARRCASRRPAAASRTCRLRLLARWPLCRPPQRRLGASQRHKRPKLLRSRLQQPTRRQRR